MTKEALKLALEALDNLAAWSDGEVGGHMDEPYSAEVARRTITAIKEALANEALEKMAENARELGLDYEPEPVAWGVFEGNLHDMFFTEAEAVEMAQLKGTYAEVKPLYTTPPQRKPLSDEEIQDLLMPVRISGDGYYLRIARAIEAAHGIKGEA